MPNPTDTEILNWLEAKCETDMDGLIIHRSATFEGKVHTGSDILIQQMLAGEVTGNMMDGQTLREAAGKIMAIERKVT